LLDRGWTRAAAVALVILGRWIATLARLTPWRNLPGILAQMACYGKTVKSCWNGEKNGILKFPPVWA
jgi:hypothetical protein